MDERKKMVLAAIIQDYIATAEPVGSRAVSKKYGLGVSPATIRNEMSDLEELGYIEQPHTSAGRVPSDKGYRYYVDFLMEKEELSASEQKFIQDSLSFQLREMDSFMRTCCQIISRLTNYPTMMVLPRQERGTLSRLQLISLNRLQALVVMITSSGAIKHQLLNFSEPISKTDLLHIEALLQQQLIGTRIDQLPYKFLRQMISELDKRQRMLDKTLQMMEELFDMEDHASKVFSAGAMHMLSQPEFRDVEKIRSIFEILEEEERIRNLLEKQEEPGVSVTIGSEIGLGGIQNCSMVISRYTVNGEEIGVLGVLGPTRMSYPRIISVVEYIAEQLSKILK